MAAAQRLVTAQRLGGIFCHRVLLLPVAGVHKNTAARGRKDGCLSTQPASTSQSGSRLARELAKLLPLAGPLIANNLALAGMNFADTVMAGRLGAIDLAAVAVGNGVWMMVFLFGLGVLMGMSPVAAQYFGSGRQADVGRAMRQCLWLSQLLALLLFIVLRQVGPLLGVIGIDPAILPKTNGYIDAISFGLPAMYAYLTLRFTSEGIGHTRPIMLFAGLGLLVNVLFNYLLMFGKFGFPKLGAVGCGYATAIAMWVMFFGLLGYVRRHSLYEKFKLFSAFEWPDRPGQRELLALGLPIGLSVLSEAGLFSVTALLMGTLGATIVAAHQIAINYAATMFMIPLALHSATTIRVGQAVGGAQAELARFAGFVGIGLCGAVMSVSAILMLIFGRHIAAFYTVDPQVQEVAIALLFVAAVFQISDGLQVGAAGALRGFKDTRVPMLINVFSYWMIGFPLAWVLGIKLQLGPQSVWTGLVAGLTVCAVLLNLRYALISKAAVRRQN